MIEMLEETKQQLAGTFLFAMENQKRLDSFIKGLDYLRTYANEGNPNLTKVILRRDPSVGEHGYVAVIEKRRVEHISKEEGGGFEEYWERVIVMGMVYHKDRDFWGFHS